MKGSLANRDTRNSNYNNFNQQPCGPRFNPFTIRNAFSLCTFMNPGASNAAASGLHKSRFVPTIYRCHSHLRTPGSKKRLRSIDARG